MPVLLLVRYGAPVPELAWYDVVMVRPVWERVPEALMELYEAQAVVAAPVRPTQQDYGQSPSISLFLFL